MACTGSCDLLENEAVIKKVREKGVSQIELPQEFMITCECGNIVNMRFHEDKCSTCGMVFAVTPCHNTDVSAVAKWME